MNKEIKVIILSLIAFTCLYILSLFVTQAVIMDEKLKHVSAIPWLLTFLAPALILSKFGNKKWYIYAITTAIFTNLIWLLHSQYLFMGIFPEVKVISNSLACVMGAYIGSKLKASNKSVKQTD